MTRHSPSWRARLLAWHRDVGFLLVGLTVAYAVSGIAVNHHHHWNYNERTVRTPHAVGSPADLLNNLSARREAALRAAPTALTEEEANQLVPAVAARLGYSTPPRNAFWSGQERLLIFYGEGDRQVVEYQPRNGVAELVQRQERALLRDLNYLHLNESRSWWTWIADAYAVLLVFLALSGATVVRGRKGLRGRGAWLLAIGVAVPLVGLLVLRYL